MRYLTLLFMLQFIPLQAIDDDDIHRIQQDILHLEASIADLDSKVELLAFSMMEFYASFMLEEPEDDLNCECDQMFRCDCDD